MLLFIIFFVVDFLGSQFEGSRIQVQSPKILSMPLQMCTCFPSFRKKDTCRRILEKSPSVIRDVTSAGKKNYSILRRHTNYKSIRAKSPSIAYSCRTANNLKKHTHPFRSLLGSFSVSSKFMRTFMKVFLGPIFRKQMVKIYSDLESFSTWLIFQMVD